MNYKFRKRRLILRILVSVLLDRGAVPDVKSMHMLRLAGLWSPTGTGLLLSPDVRHISV